jgi:biopolymer transport protein ExbB
MIPIILSSILALAIIGERFWALQQNKICPKHLLAQVWTWIKNNELDTAHIKQLQAGSPLGRVLAAGLINRAHDRSVMKEAIEETGRQIVMELERYLTTLGSIAVLSPLLGLFGTVLGIINIFTVVGASSMGDPHQLAAGISTALITTAGGLFVAIPALLMHRHFQRRVEELVVSMEQEALKLVEVLAGMRERDLPMENGR